MRKILILSLFMFLVLFTNLAFATTLSKEKIITKNFIAEDNTLNSDGNYIAWVNLTKKNNKSTQTINLYDIKKGKTITISTNGEKPVISNSKVVWREFVKGNFEIFIYDLKTKKKNRLTSTKENETDPFIFGSYIAWEKEVVNNEKEVIGNDIYLYNLKTKKNLRITDSTKSDNNEQYFYPKIYDNILLYESFAGTYIYNLKTKKLIKEIPGASHPSIYKNNLVYDKYKDGETDVYILDLNTNKESTISNLEQHLECYPVINGSYIAWEDRNSGITEIWLYNIKTKTKLKVISGSGSVQSPLLAGNNIVWVDTSNIKTETDELAVVYLKKIS